MNVRHAEFDSKKYRFVGSCSAITVADILVFSPYFIHYRARQECSGKRFSSNVLDAGILGTQLHGKRKKSRETVFRYSYFWKNFINVVLSEVSIKWLTLFGRLYLCSVYFDELRKGDCFLNRVR